MLLLIVCAFSALRHKDDTYMGRIAGDRSAWSASGSQKQFEPQKSLIKDITAGGGHGVSGNGAASACAQSKELEENAMGWLRYKTDG
jgi:hypothetical protein